MLLLLASRGAVFAADRSRPFDEYAHTAWRLRDAAFKGYPRSLAQATDGYLWLGTESGLVRFDGQRFVAWRPSSNATLPSDAIVKVAAAHDGALWIGTVQGLARWKDGTLTVFPPLNGQIISALLEDRAGTVWVGTSAGVTGTGKLCAVRGEQVECRSEAMFGRFVIALHERVSGELWIGAETGLWRRNTAAPAIASTRGEFLEVHAIADDPSGGLLVAFSREIRRVAADGRTDAFPTGLGLPIKPTALLRDRQGGLWIGTQDRGLLHVRDGVTDRFQRPDGLSGDFVTSLFEDAEGNVWAATLNGLDRFRHLALSTLTTKQGLSTDTVMSVLGARDGTVWLGTIRGLNAWRNGAITQAATPLRHESIGSLFEDSRGRLWLSSTQGLAYLTDGSLSAPIIERGYVQAVAEGGDDDLWAVEQEHGLYHLRGATVVDVIPWSAFEGRRARTIAVDPRSRTVWLGFFGGGIAALENGRIGRTFTVGDGLGAGTVTQLRFDNDGALWAATDGGLSRVQGGAVATLTSRNGLPCDPVRWAIEDEPRSLWLYTACGVVRLSHEDVTAWTVDPRSTVRASVFDSADGIPVNADLGSYDPKVTRSRDGRLWFATYDGVGVIDPRKLQSNVVVPRVHIEQVVVDRTTREPVQQLRLPPLVRDLRIDYTALSLTAADKIRFRYRLEGRDDNWVDARDRRQAFYTDLPPRSYRFRVIAANSDGVWNHEGASWAFSIQPAFYQTIAFKVGIALVALLAGWAAYRVRVRSLAARLNVRFEERLAERTRIAQDLHDTLLQGSLSAAMQLDVVANQVTDTSLKARLDHILRRIREVSEESRRTVQALRVEPAAIEDLDRSLRRDAEQLRGAQDVTIQVVVEGRRRALHPLIRDEVYRIGREAIVNAYRHAGATRVHLEIEYRADGLRLCVRDNGRGIPPSTLEAGRPGHWGLVGMRERAERIGGTLKIMSGVNSGTEVVISVPAAIAFADRASSIRGFFKLERSAIAPDRHARK